VDAGYQKMADIIQPDNKAEGQVVSEEDEDQIGTGPVKVTDEDIKEETKQRKIKQYGVGEGPGKKVKQPGRLKRPTTVKPAIK
jgi:hypothetical protein